MTAADQTDNNPNVGIINEPYEEGGVYLNGNYLGSDPDSSKVLTPTITATTGVLSCITVVTVLPSRGTSAIS